MRPLGIYLIGISIYLECDSFPDDFGRFRRFSLMVTDGPTDIRTDTPSYRDARTHLKRNGRKRKKQRGRRKRAKSMKDGEGRKKKYNDE